MKKTVCLVDSNYLNSSLSTFFGQRPKINYEKLIPFLTDNDPNILRTYFYDCRTFMGQTPTEEELQKRSKQQRFHNYLQTLPQVECRFGRLKKVVDEKGEVHYEQKKVDVMFSIDLVKLATKHLIDKAVLVTGDLDMLPAIQVAKDEGVIVHLWFARGYTHHDLLRGVDVAKEIEPEGFSQILETRPYRFESATSIDEMPPQDETRYVPIMNPQIPTFQAPQNPAAIAVSAMQQPIFAPQMAR